MAELKTKLTGLSVEDFLNSIPDEQKRKDSIEIMGMMEEVTGEKPAMWGAAIVGFGTLRYKYASGREGDWMIIGFSPRKQNISLYLSTGQEIFPELLSKLGKHKIGKGCLYINKLADVDPEVLKKIIKKSAERMREMYK